MASELQAAGGIPTMPSSIDVVENPSGGLMFWSAARAPIPSSSIRHRRGGHGHVINGRCVSRELERVQTTPPRRPRSLSSPRPRTPRVPPQPRFTPDQFRFSDRVPCILGRGIDRRAVSRRFLVRWQRVRNGTLMLVLVSVEGNSYSAYPFSTSGPRHRRNRMARDACPGLRPCIPSGDTSP